MQFIQGQKQKIGDLLNLAEKFSFVVSLNSPLTIDVAVFGLDSNARLSDEAYMIFYNQPTSPCGAVKLVQNSPTQTIFEINLSQLNPKIERLVVTLAIDPSQPQGVMSQLQASSLTVNNTSGQPVATFNFAGNLFAQERAIMLFEAYKKDSVWRFNAIAQGFNGGLDKLIEHFGGEVAKEGANETALQQSPATQPTSVAPVTNTTNNIDLKKKISLEKAQKTGNPSIIDLTKKSLVQLEKKNLLNVQARVALVLDASGSMNWQYKNGDVQKVVDRLMPLAINFDDDGSFECWAFAQHTQQLDDVTLQNVNGYINATQRGWQNWQVGSRINAEIPAIQAVIQFYTGMAIQPSASTGGGLLSRLLGNAPNPAQTPTPPSIPKLTGSQLPIYVLFISDGGVGSSSQMQKILTEAAHLPIFWQFVGIGGSNYGVLEKLDDMTGRVVDNCNFFALDTIKSVSDEKLYKLLLEEFPDWLKNARQQGILV